MTDDFTPFEQPHERGTHWQAEAACANTDPAIFHPAKGDSNAHAKRICNGCPVRTMCLEYAIDNFEDGIWGATSAKERQIIRRGLRGAA